MKKILLSAILSLASIIQIAAQGSIAGNYHWEYYSYINNAGTTTEDIVIEAVDDSSTDFLIILPDGNKVNARFDSESQTLVLSGDNFLYTDPQMGDVYFYKQRWNIDWSATISHADEDIVAQYSNGTFTFDRNDLITIGAHDQDPIFMARKNSFTYFIPFNEIEDNDTYIPFGTAEFIDGWTAPLLGVNQRNSEYINEIPVEKNVDNEGIYRLVNPYGGHHKITQMGANECDGTGYIRFNISNPDFPFFYPVKSGLEISIYGGHFYFYDINGYLHYMLGRTPEDILANYLDYRLTTFNPETGTLELFSARYGVTGNEAGCAYWMDDQKAAADMYTRIKLHEYSGVENVTANGGNAEYYNLQGVRVENPSAGVYIRIIGGKAEKVYVK